MARRKTIQRDPYGSELSEFEEEEEEDGLLKDGQTLRVPLYLKDGAINPDLTPTQRAKAIAARQPLVNDGTSNPMAMHRPGFRYHADATQRAISDAVKAEALQEVDEISANAWRGHADGHLRQGNSKFERVLNRRQDAATFDAKQAAYEHYDREMAVAWRIGK
jgi:hypothetical protein